MIACHCTPNDPKEYSLYLLLGRPEVFSIFQVDISAHVAYVMAAKEDNELSHVKVSKVHECSVLFALLHGGSQRCLLLNLDGNILIDSHSHLKEVFSLK